VSRIFLSHSSLDSRQTIALQRWLIEQDPPLRDEIFLDLDYRGGISPGAKWKDVLRQASTRCEAVICVLSSHWEDSPECNVEYRFAEYLNKRVFCAAIAPLAGEDPTREWQRVDLYGQVRLSRSISATAVGRSIPLRGRVSVATTSVLGTGARGRCPPPMAHPPP
jgi:hypothetical protein